MRRASLLLALPFATLLAACGGGSSPPPDLSESAQRGFTLADDNGCFACHGDAGSGGVGPTWEGLFGSEVELSDGTTVVADREYLVRAIVDPGAEKVKGATVAMPGNALSADEVEAVVDYIEALAES